MKEGDLKILIVKPPSGFGSPVDTAKILNGIGVTGVETVVSGNFDPAVDFPWSPNGIIFEPAKIDQTHRLFEKLRPTQPEIPVIVVSGFSGKPNSPENKAAAAKLKETPYKADEVLFGQQAKEVQKGLEAWVAQLANKTS